MGVTSTRRFEKRTKEHGLNRQFENIKILLEDCTELCYTYEYVLRPLPHIGWNKATGGAKGRELNFSYSAKTKKKIGLANTGNKRPDLSAYNRSRKGIKQKIIKCPHCGKEDAANSMKRYHFDNCTGFVRKAQTNEEIYSKEKSLIIYRNTSINQTGKNIILKSVFVLIVV